MNQKIHIHTAELNHQELLLYTNDKRDLTALLPARQMLVDSDQLSFIYIAELDGEYNYITIPEEVWHLVREGVKAGLEVYLINQDSRLRLESFIEEMNYLVENIKGNSNYGEEMVEKVESIFN